MPVVAPLALVSHVSLSARGKRLRSNRISSEISRRTSERRGIIAFKEEKPRPHPVVTYSSSRIRYLVCSALWRDFAWGQTCTLRPAVLSVAVSAFQIVHAGQSAVVDRGSECVCAGAAANAHPLAAIEER